jgi:phage baseplate assembly protein W
LERLPRAPSTSIPATQRAPEDITYRGIALPTAQRPYPSVKEELELIRDSIVTILLTKKGQRLFAPDFGSNLWRIIFEPNDDVTRSLAREYIISAIQTWEPRVNLRAVTVQSDEHTLTLFMNMSVRRINQIMNLRIDVSRDTFAFQSITAEAA